MSDVVTVIAITLLVVASLAVLAALAIAVGAFVPLFARDAAVRRTSATLDSAAEIWREADEVLRTNDVGWEGATPAMLALSRVATRDIEFGLAAMIPGTP